MAEFMGEIMKAVFDKNGDNKLQTSELPERLQQMPMFEGIDADNSGGLNDQEIRAMLNRILTQPTANSDNGATGGSENVAQGSDQTAEASCAQSAEEEQDSSSGAEGSGGSEASETTPAPQNASEPAQSDENNCGCGPGSDTASMFERFLLTLFDANGDGKLSLDELPEQLRNRLAQFDADGNSTLETGKMASAGEQLMNAAGQTTNTAA
jgi:hypothetical protein